MFILIAIALIGLICIGLMGLGGVLFFTQSNRAQEIAAAQTAAVPATVVPPTDTPTSTITPTPTFTPEPTSTSTPVVSGETAAQVDEPTQEEESGSDQPPEGEGGEAGNAVAVTPTSTMVVQSTTPASEAESAVSTPAAPSEVMPSSGGILPVTSRGYLLWISGGLVVVLLVYGALYRTR